METIGNETLVSALGNRELDTRKLAEDIGCSHVSIWHWLNHERRMSIANWLKLMKALGKVKVGQNSITIRTELAPEIKENMKYVRTHGYYRD